ncbi:MAG: hypothetical protein ACOYLE_09255 [Bacteroidales bacterium]
MYLIIYLLIVLAILIKTYGIITIIKGFINKNQKQWVKGFYLVALACILFVTMLAVGIHGCPKFMKCKKECHDEWMMKNDSCKMSPNDMPCCKMRCMEMMQNCCKHEKMDSTMCKEHKCMEEKPIK